MEEKEVRKARLEVSRGLDNEREGQEFQGRGQEVSKRRLLAGRTQVQKKDTHTRTRARRGLFSRLSTSSQHPL